MPRLNFLLTARLAVVRLLMALGLLTLLAGGARAAQDNYQTEQVSASLLLHAPQGVRAGAPVWAGLLLEHAPHWHTYWQNPGDSGLPTTLVWTLPQGISAGDIAWPAPRRIPLGPLANYGYEGTVLLPVPLAVAPDYAGDELSVTAVATWLVCKTECIPQTGTLTAKLPASGSGSDWQALFDDAEAARPRAHPGTRAQARIEDAALALEVDGLPSDWRGQTLTFFAGMPGVIETGAPWTQDWQGDRWTARVPLSEFRSASPDLLPVVLTRDDLDRPGSNPSSALALEVPTAGPWPAMPDIEGLSPALEAALAQGPAAESSPSTLGWGAALLGALLGGVLLNLMPCVFPILAVKVLAFAKHGGHARAHRLAGLAYTAGVLLSFTALGAVLVLLRAGGEQIGWGFQLQSPVVVASLAGLFLLIALNLFGVFEVGSVLPARWAEHRAKTPAGDAFLSGVLASAVASPCTAPFMGASLGLAVTMPTAQALSVFAAIGLGMALPYLAASWLPGVARHLPRPGAWMQTLRQVLAFPMLATVIWLLWVLDQQAGPHATALTLATLLALAWLVWAWGQRGRARWALGALGLVALGLLVPATAHQFMDAQDTDGPNLTAAPGVGTDWQGWSPELVQAQLAQGRSVFIDFTAAWCVTCQYNKKVVLEDEEVVRAFADASVARLRADWTRRDPLVTQALAELGRSGVPTYALLAPGRAPRLLPEVLSKGDTLRLLRGL